MKHYGYLIENRLFWRGMDGWEKISLRLWVELSRKASVIVDVGANTGVYALIAEAVNPEATIVAVEPIERVYRKLVANIHLNKGSIIPVQAAISDRNGTAMIYDQVNSEHVLAVSLEEEWGRDQRILEAVEVPVKTIQLLLEEHGRQRLDLIKIDVEGHEPNVIRGAREVIRRDRPSILIEILSEGTAGRVAELVDGLGYLYFSIDEVHWPPGQIPNLTKSAYYNVLICRPDVAASIGIYSPL